jgi:hypothetical protein
VRRFLSIVGGATAGLLAPAAAEAAEKPVVRTGGPSNVAQSTVVLNGSVNPGRAATTYFFQYGTTRLYGANTAAGSAGAGRRAVRVSAAVGGLVPATTYHFRLVARNAKGLTFGRDRTFRTRRQPLALLLAAIPNPIRTGRSTVLGGALTGTGNAGRQVVLQANPYPYTQGFVTITNPQLTNAQGGFAFPVLGTRVNTQYRVLMPRRPHIISSVVVLATTVRVTTRVRVMRRGPRMGRLRFRGRLSPAADGELILIQKRRRGGQWRTIARTFARDNGARSSRYVKRIRQRRGGRYRVVANADGEHVPSAGRTVRVRRVRN